MAITTTLSRLKNYFVGWHTANYEILHELTDDITSEEPEGHKAIRSRAIAPKINEIETNITDINSRIGEPCTPRDGGETLWSNICTLWTKFWDYTGQFADWNGNIWNPGWTKGPSWGSIYGWIALLRDRTGELGTRMRNAEINIDNIKGGDWGLGAFADYNTSTNTTSRNSVWGYINSFRRDSVKITGLGDNKKGIIRLYRSGGIGVLRISNFDFKGKESTYPKVLYKFSSAYDKYEPATVCLGSFSYDECKWVAVYPKDADYTYHTADHDASWNNSQWIIGVRPKTTKTETRNMNATIVYPLKRTY